MTQWTAEILADIARDYANHDDIAELARGAAAVLTLCDAWDRDGSYHAAVTARIRAALNNPIGDTP